MFWEITLWKTWTYNLYLATWHIPTTILYLNIYVVYIHLIYLYAQLYEHVHKIFCNKNMGSRFFVVSSQLIKRIRKIASFAHLLAQPNSNRHTALRKSLSLRYEVSQLCREFPAGSFVKEKDRITACNVFFDVWWGANKLWEATVILDNSLPYQPAVLCFGG